jgi:hypothetical protein
MAKNRRKNKKKQTKQSRRTSSIVRRPATHRHTRNGLRSTCPDRAGHMTRGQTTYYTDADSLAAMQDAGAVLYDDDGAEH